MVASSQSPRNAPRGPAAQRRRGARADRDGDLNMGVAIKGRGRVGKAPPTGPAGSSRGDPTSRASRGGARRGLLSGTARGAILRQAASGDVSMKEGRVGTSRGGLVQLEVTGWEKNKNTSAADGGVSNLISWMERKASNRLGSRRSVKVKKVCCRQHLAIRRTLFCQPAAISGPPSFAANLRTTTAIRILGFSHG